MDIKLIRSTNLRNLIRNYTEEGKTIDFAEATGLDPGQMSALLNRHRNMGEKLARRIEAAAGVPSGLLDNPEGYEQLVKENASTYRISAFKRVNRVPVISWGDAGQWLEIMDSFRPGGAIKWLETTQPVSDKSFALLVSGHPMSDPGNPSLIPDGALLTVDPDITPGHAHLVVAKLVSSEDATLKKLIIDGPNRYLESLNTKYEPIKIDDTCIIIGVVKKVEFEP